MAVVVAVDAGTTGVRSVAFDENARLVAIAYRELTQYFPRPGLVEHDAGEIARLVEETLAELAARLEAEGESVAAVGITNQRETAVAWDLQSGQPLGRAIVWQDRRTAGRCRELEETGVLPLVRARTGLTLDSYFSATKWEWMLSHGGIEQGPSLALGTVDAWVAFVLTGRHVTDPSNASRTLCYDITAQRWSSELCALFHIDPSGLPEVVPSSGRVAPLRDGLAGGRLGGTVVAGIAGDQQAALFGHGCTAKGATKVTYGTGSFVLMNLGPDRPEPVDGLLTTVGWQLADDAATPISYVLEGAVFSSGATIQWLRDGLGIIEATSEIGPLAASIPSSEGVAVVPAFTGLGSPWWDPQARGTIVGITRGVGRAHFARAAVEAISFQTRDVLDAMARSAACEVSELRADGGAAIMDLLLQMQADQCQVPVVRPETTEVTALGAALLAGVAEGVWSLGDVAALAREAARFEPMTSPTVANAKHRQWLDALERSRHWVEAEQ